MAMTAAIPSSPGGSSGRSEERLERCEWDVAGRGMWRHLGLRPGQPMYNPHIYIYIIYIHCVYILIICLVQDTGYWIHVWIIKLLWNHAVTGMHVQVWGNRCMIWWLGAYSMFVQLSGRVVSQFTSWSCINHQFSSAFPLSHRGMLLGPRPTK